MPERGKQQDDGDAARRGGGPRALAGPLGAVTRRALGRRGFAETGLITGWDEIVGAELATACRPDRLSFAPGRRDGGTLRIRVAGGVATELQHLTPTLLERINGHFGYRAVARLAFVHIPPAAAPARQRGRRDAAAAPVDPAARTAVEAALDRVSDPEIRAALARLGRAVVASGGRRSR